MRIGSPVDHPAPSQQVLPSQSAVGQLERLIEVELGVAPADQPMVEELVDGRVGVFGGGDRAQRSAVNLQQLAIGGVLSGLQRLQIVALAALEGAR